MPTTLDNSIPIEYVYCLSHFLLYTDIFPYRTQLSHIFSGYILYECIVYFLTTKMLITQQMYIFHNARKYHATSDLASNWLIDPYVATPLRNKLKNRSNGKEIFLKMVKTRLCERARSTVLQAKRLQKRPRRFLNQL